MKSIQLVICFCTLFFFQGIAQDAPKNMLRFGFGNAYLGSGSNVGKLRYVEYNRRLFWRVSTSLSGGWTDGSQFKENDIEERTKAYQGDLNLLFAPVQTEVNSIKFGGGASYRYARTTLESLDNQGIGISDPNMPIETEGYSLGYTAMAEYELYIARVLTIGTRVAFQKYENSDRVFYWGLNAGVRF